MITPTVDDIYKSCKIAQTKSDFEENGYAEYFNGLYTVNDLAEVIVGLYGTVESMKQTNKALIKKLQASKEGDYHEKGGVPLSCETGDGE